MDKSSKIFLVDDELFSLNFHRQSLENLGYSNITLFLSGTTCLNNLHKKPELIFLDHNMDDILGFDVLKKIKRYDSDLFVVMLSAQEEMEIAIDALKFGAFDYIIKDDNTLIKIQKVMERIELIKGRLEQSKPTILQKIKSIF